MTRSSSPPRDAHAALWAKRRVVLSGGVFDRADPARGPRADRTLLSRYSPYRGVRDATLASGVLEGILTLLAGSLLHLTAADDGHAGTARLASLSRPGAAHDLSWQAQPEALRLGGFPTETDGSVRATYHAAALGLIARWTAWAWGTEEPGEVLERWWALLTVLETWSPRPSGGAGWPEPVLAAACAGAGAARLVRDALAGLADSLWLDLRYPLPDLAGTRALAVASDPIALEGAPITLDPVSLLVPRRGAVVRIPISRSPSPAPSTTGTGVASAAGTTTTSVISHSAPEAYDPDLDLADEDDALPPPCDASTSTPSAASTPTAAEDALVETVDGARIRRAMCAPGAVFLLGPAGQGKTEWTKRLAREYYDGCELVQLTPRVQEEDLYGTNVQDPTGRWTLAPGAVTRWARRVEDGTRLVLLLDEFPRAHPSLRDGVMALLNLHSRADLRAAAIPTPEDDGPYHLVDVPGDRIYALPASRVKIVATGNLGESYRGLDLSDAAFLDRWASWVHLAGLSKGETRAVLAVRLHLPLGHALLGVLVEAAAAVEEYRRVGGGLRAGVTLRTLLRWGEGVLVELGGPPAHVPDAALAEAVVGEARVQWLDKVCPLDGDKLDAAVMADLLSLVQRAARSRS